MRVLVTLSLLGAAAVLSSCVPETQVYQSPGSTIWESPSRYGRPEPQRARLYQPQDLQPSSGTFRTYTGINRYGSESDQRYPDSRSVRSFGNYDRAAVASRGEESSRSESRLSSSSEREPRVEAQREEVRMSRSTSSDEMLASAGRQQESSTSSGAASDDYSHLPYAQPVPGRSGFVKLPNRDASLPDIDVRGIASGTAVEIPDPASPGSTIQFRVP